MKELDHSNFEAEAMKGNVVLDFWATWCNPCKQLLPILEAAQKEIPHVKICKIDVDHNLELAKRFGVRGVPALVFLKDGKEVSRNVGVLSVAEIKSRTQQLFK